MVNSPVFEILTGEQRINGLVYKKEIFFRYDSDLPVTLLLAHFPIPDDVLTHLVPLGTTDGDIRDIVK